MKYDRNERKAIRLTSKGWTIDMATNILAVEVSPTYEGRYRITGSNYAPTLKGKTCLVRLRKRKVSPGTVDWPQQIAKQIRIYKNPIVLTY